METKRGRGAPKKNEPDNDRNLAAKINADQHLIVKLAASRDNRSVASFVTAAVMEKAMRETGQVMSQGEAERIITSLRESNKYPSLDSAYEALLAKCSDIEFRAKIEGWKEDLLR